MLFCLSNLSPVTPYNYFPTECGVDCVHHTCVCCFFQDTTEDYGDNKPSLVDFRGDEFEERMLRKQRQAPPPPSTIPQPTPAPRRLSSAARPVSLQSAVILRCKAKSSFLATCFFVVVVGWWCGQLDPRSVMCSAP